MAKQISETEERVKYRIEGEFCANCSAKMERALSVTEGIGETTINYATKTVFLPSSRVVQAQARANSLAELFKTLGDPTRIRIMDALAKSEFCVCDLAELLGLSQSATSHQLRVLRNSNLVKYRRDGKMVFYSMHDSHVSELYRQGLEHIDEG